MALSYVTVTPGVTTVAAGTTAILAKIVVTGSAADFTSEAPTLNVGQIGYETDTGQFKIGDGSTAWASLAYGGGSGGAASSGAAAPTATPSAVGEVYIETTNDRFYIAVGATDADWERVTLQSDLDAIYTSSTADPASTPTAVGNRHINTSNKTAWVAVGTGSSADWRRDNVRFITGIAEPTVNDDTLDGYLVGDIWHYNDRAYYCAKNSTGAADWQDIGLTSAQVASLVLADSALQEADALPAFDFGTTVSAATLTASMDNHAVITPLTHASGCDVTIPAQADEDWAEAAFLHFQNTNAGSVKGDTGVTIGTITAGSGYQMPAMTTVTVYRTGLNTWWLSVSAAATAV